MARSDASISKAKAVQDIEDIDVLRGTPTFARYFERRVADPMREIANKILYNQALSADEIWNEILRFRAMYDVSKMLGVDDAACRRMIEKGPPPFEG